MELRHLRYFLAVASENHFGRAASRLHIVQPALSMQIRALEDELGTPLFIRTSRRVELSEAGKLFLVEAQRTIVQADRAKSVVQRWARGEIGSIRIGFAGNAAMTGKLSHDLRDFHAASPEVEIELHEMSPALQERSLIAGSIDVGYCPAAALTFDSQLNAHRCGDWPWNVAMSNDHRLAKKRHLSASMMSSEPFIVYATDSADDAQLTVLRAILGCEPRVAHRVGNTLTVLTLAASGLGLALVPEPLNKVMIPNIIFKRLAGEDFSSGLVMLSREVESSPAVKGFLELARAAIR